MGYFKDWWKSLFSGSGETDELGFPVMKREDIPPMPKVKPPKPEKDISEPVLSFVEIYKENPKRFKVLVLWSEPTNALEQKEFLGFELRDTKLNKRFSVNENCSCLTTRTGSGIVYRWNYTYSAIKNTSWMTEDEKDLVYNFVKIEREERRKSLHLKKETLQRKRLTKLYKGE